MSAPSKTAPIPGMSHRVLAEYTTCAGPSAARTSAADSASKKALCTRPPATPVGSKARWRTPASATVRRVTPSLQPISTKNGSGPPSSRARNPRPVSSKCACITVEPAEWYG